MSHGVNSEAQCKLTGQESEDLSRRTGREINNQRAKSKNTM